MRTVKELKEFARRYFPQGSVVDDGFEITINTGMLDPHLVERCDRVYGHGNYLNVLIVGTQIDQKSQRYRELERYFTPDRTHNLWVIMCSEAFGPADIEFIGERLREMSRKVMGLD